MEEILLPSKVEVKKEKNNQATIVIEPCYPGYGVTLGNALRRVLLSSLPGAAVTSIKIKGIEHEFSTIPYIKEDVVNIILNLKNLRLKIFTKDPVKLHLLSKGKKEILARDIKVPSTAEIVNPDLHIATATHKNALLDMEIEASQGRGYVPVEQRKGEVELGKILIDSIFTPIIKVGYEIENVRVGKRTDFDRLILNIVTDGTISAADALAKASRILVDQFSFIFSTLKPKETLKKEKSKVKKAPAEIKKETSKTISIKELKLSTRTLNALTKAGFHNVSDIVKLSEEDLLKLEGFGERGLKEIKKELKKLKLEIKE